MQLAKEIVMTVSAEAVGVENRCASLLEPAEDEFLAVEICGYHGYSVRWMAPRDANMLWNLAKCEPGSVKLTHRHPGSDSILILLSGEVEFLVGGGQTAPARAGDILFSVNGLPHGVKNVGSETAYWFYVEGPMPLVSELPTSEIRMRNLRRSLAETREHAIGHMKESLHDHGRSAAVLGGGDMSSFGRQSLPPEAREALLNPLTERILSHPSVTGRVRIYDGYSTRMHSPDFGNTKLWVHTPAVESEIPLHRRPGSDAVLVLLEGEAEFLWAPGEEGPVQTTRLVPGMAAWALDGEYHGLRNLGSQPAKYVTVEGPQPQEGTEILWRNGPPASGDMTVGVGDA